MEETEHENRAAFLMWEKSARKRRRTLHLALLDASQEKTPNIIGTVVSCHNDMATATLAQREFDSSQKNPRSRIAKLLRFLPVGSPVYPAFDLAPVTRRE
jgi:hypothetical protein